MLKKALDSANIEYTLGDNVYYLIERGIAQVPVLEIDKKLLNYNEAIAWIKEREGNI
jgi:hypothetical protein